MGDEMNTDTTVCVDAPSWAAAKSTYRYLRLSIVVVVVTLGISLALEVIEHGCVQGSVSAFYYTPVHSVFVAALALIGLALIAIRGSTPRRDALLNMAGLLAPIVAFIPTGRPGPRKAPDATCPLDPSIGAISRAFSDNNLWAFLLGGLLALAAVIVPVLLRRPDRTRTVRKVVLRTDVFVPVVGAGTVLLALLVWRWQWPSSFGRHAHSYSAIVMFVFAGWFVAVTARNATGAYRRVYWACAGVMAGGLLYAIVVGQTGNYYTVLVVEVIETVGFLGFWLAQSIELWDVGVRVAHYTDPAKAIPSAS